MPARVSFSISSKFGVPVVKFVIMIYLRIIICFNVFSTTVDELFPIYGAAFPLGWVVVCCCGT